MAKISVVIPIYPMENAIEFLKRNLDSVSKQTFKDYDVIISDDSDDDVLAKFVIEYFSTKPIYFGYFKHFGPKGMAQNTNHAIEKSTGELVKILFQDDYFYSDRSLQDIVKHFTPTCQWLVTGCIHTMDGLTMFNEHRPYYSNSENTIGSPSVMTFRRELTERFNPAFSWVLDLDLYRRLYKKYGKPKILDTINIVIGIGYHQTTYKLTDQRKFLEHEQLKKIL